MKLLEAKVNWNDGWGNSPELQILVDKIPGREELKYERRNRHFVAYHPDGYVAFVAGDPQKPGRGYGGDSFHLNMIDGSEVTLIGPWSSRAGAVNEDFAERPVFDCEITDSPEDFKCGLYLLCRPYHFGASETSG